MYMCIYTYIYIYIYIYIEREREIHTYTYRMDTQPDDFAALARPVASGGSRGWFVLYEEFARLARDWAGSN